MKLYTPNTGKYNFAMAYPAKEEFALASLGYLWLYMLADKYDGINAIRISTDDTSVNSAKLDSVAFSISYEFDVFGVLEILNKLQIPFLAEERNENFPLIFAGGPVISTNPRPYEKFFDFMILGDGEETFTKVLECLRNKLSKENTLKELKKISGIYIPGKKARSVTADLVNVIHTPILSEKGYFKNTFITEISRGCMNRCAFCIASYLNLPYRYYEYDKIIQTLEFGLNYTNKIALLGAQVTAHPRFDEIIDYLKNKMDSGTNIELGISSLRTDSITPNLIRTLVKGGQKHSTIAIEAASEKLRSFINKNLKEEQIINAVKICRENGLKGLKIYSMIGIPEETDEDIADFIRLAKKIKDLNKGFNIEFSFSDFVPKPQTPFQWSKRDDTKTLLSKQKFLEKNLAKLGISAKFSSPKWGYWQTILSRCDENIAPVLIKAYKDGGSLGSLKQALKISGVDVSKAIYGYNYDEILPWDIITDTHTKQLLINEHQRLTKRLREYI